jgi:hypothetical protein
MARLLHAPQPRISRRLLCWVPLALVIAAPAFAQTAPHPLWQPEVRVRVGYYGSWGDQRDGSFTELHTGQGRVLAGLAWRPSRTLHAQGRLATRFSTEQARWHLRLPDYQPGPEGLAAGDVGLDQLFVSWRPVAAWDLRAGRMQLQFGLPDVTNKSLQRKDGSNLNITWVDGIHARADVPGVGRGHLALIYTSPVGVATAFRRPLQFDRESGRLGVFAVLEGRRPVGPVVHRSLQATVLPRALPDVAGDRGLYAAISAQGAVAVPVAGSGLLEGARIMVATEAGWTPTPPERAPLRLPGEGRAGGAAGVLGLSLMGFGGGAHDVGVVASAAEAGWLLSPDFRPNNREVEARYYWRFAPQQRFDVRLRRRQDLVVPTNALRGRDEWDVYVRYNVRF